MPTPVSPSSASSCTNGGAVERVDHHTDEARVRPYTLPPLLPPACTAEEFEATTRPELLQLFREHVYGHSPPPPPELTFAPLGPDELVEYPGLYNCKRREVRVQFTADPAGPGFTLLLYLPAWASAARPAPLFLGCNFGGNHTVHPEPGCTASLVHETQFAHPDRGYRGAAAHRWQV